MRDNEVKRWERERKRERPDAPRSQWPLPWRQLAQGRGPRRRPEQPNAILQQRARYRDILPHIPRADDRRVTDSAIHEPSNSVYPMFHFPTIRYFHSLSAVIIVSSNINRALQKTKQMFNLLINKII